VRVRNRENARLTAARESKVARRKDNGRNPTAKELEEVDKVAALPPAAQKLHRSTVPADSTRLAHINTYGALPEYYVDRPFTCRKCGKREIWRADDQKWYYEEAKGHIDARAVECHACRTSGRS
jgi:hypothetical protein